MTDKFVLQSSTQWINDNIINVAQTMIKRNVPSINGFQHTQLGKKLQFKIIDSKSPFIQILHVSGNHWVVVSNINCSKDVINIYDSLNTHVNKATLYQLFTFFKPQTRLVKLGLVNIQKQTNNCDCGLFAIAVAFELAAGNDPLSQRFITNEMRHHVINCFEKGEIQLFPKEIVKRRVQSQYNKVITEMLVCSCFMPFDEKREMRKFPIAKYLIIYIASQLLEEMKTGCVLHVTRTLIRKFNLTLIIIVTVIFALLLMLLLHYL